MDSSSVVASEHSSVSTSIKGVEGPVSLTHAFMVVVLQNDVCFFPSGDIRDSRIYLGEGATSTVYKSSVNPSYGTVEAQVVAIKQKRRRGPWFDLDVPLESWLRAAYLDLRIMSHPPFKQARNIVTALGYFWEYVEMDGKRRISPCLVLPAANSETPTIQHYFDDSSAKQYQIFVRAKMKFCRDVANGLSELHKAGVVHGDLKLSNILLFNNNRHAGFDLKITDFSHSFVMSDFESTSQKPRYTGTRPFTIPEIRRQDKFTDVRGSDLKETGGVVPVEDFYACDVFSLGLLIFTILNDGCDLVSIIRQNLSRQGIEPDEWLTETKLDELCDNSRGIFGLCTTTLRTSTFSSEMGADDSLASAVEQCLQLCLQHDPKKRGSAGEVFDVLDKWLGASEEEHQRPSLRRSQIGHGDIVPGLYGSLYEFMVILSSYSTPQHATTLQCQIFSEALRKSQAMTAKSAFFLACCYALGLGTEANLEEAVKHLDLAGKLGHASSLAVLDRVAFFTGYQIGTIPYLIDGITTLSKDYSARMKQTKAAMSPRSDYNGIVVSNRKPKYYGFHPHSALQSQDLIVGTGSDRKRPRKGITRSQSFRTELLEDTDGHPPLAHNPYLDIMVEEITEASRSFHQLQSSFDDSLATIDKLTSMLTAVNQPPDGGLLHIAVNFFGSDSSFPTQTRVLQLVRAVNKRQGPLEISRRNQHGETPLLMACRLGQTLAARYLLSIGADAKVFDNSGITPLHWIGFLEESDAETMGPILAGAGAPLGAKTTAHIDLYEHCFNLQSDCTPLHFAVAMRNLTAVRVLLKLGADPFAIAEISLGFQGHGLTPLHFAICLHFHEIVKELIQLPGTSSEVLFKRKDEQTAGHVSIVHLVGLHLFMPSDVSPFGRWILHGQDREAALEKTLKNILSVFPDRKVLVPTRHFLAGVALPANDPYIWRIFKSLGIGLKRLTTDEMGLPSDATMHQGPNYEVELWARAAVNASYLNKSSPLMMDVALLGFEEEQIVFDTLFFFQIIETCAKHDIDGILSSLLHRKGLREEAVLIIGFAFWLAAEHNASAVMEVIWKVYVESAQDPKKAEQEYLHFVYQEMSPLHQAAKANAVQAAMFLLDKGADINLDLGDNGTPINLAASTFLSCETAVLLLERGADLNCCKAKGAGFNVLHAGVESPDIHLKGEQDFSTARVLFEACPTRFLGDSKDGVDHESRLKSAAGDSPKALPINSTDFLGQTPLHQAAKSCDIATVELLLGIGGADLSITDGLGETALMAALYRLHFNQEYTDGFIEYLQEQGVGKPSADLRDQAWQHKQFQCIVNMLIKAGSPLPEVDETTGEFKFLLHHAARQVFEQIDTVTERQEIVQIVTARFAKFGFMMRPSSRTGLAAIIIGVDNFRGLMIFPHGMYRDAPCVLLRRTT